MVPESGGKFARGQGRVRAYLWSVRQLSRGVRLLKLLESLLIGFWLGTLSRDELSAVDDEFYVGSGKQRSPIDYRSEEYNRRGLFGWEQRAINEHFTPGASLALMAAGGGREVLALRRASFQVDAWECQPDFVSFANRLLVGEGFEPSVAFAPRNRMPVGSKRYGGLVIGWGAYTLIPGRQQRVELLRDLRSTVGVDAPILLSFWVRRSGDARYRIAARVGNVVRRARRRERVELGDYLGPAFVHVFTKEELAAELAEGGFELQYFKQRPYGHAVARAR